MKTQTIRARINLMLYVVGLIFLFLLFKILHTTVNQEKLIQKESLSLFQNEANLLIASKTETLPQVANDYTFWDEFVSNMERRDSVWFTDNITTILKSYRVDFVAVYDSSFNFVHEASANSVKMHSAISKEILIKLQKKRFLNYFQILPDGMYEFSAASLHLEIDPTHLLTRPRGYLFIAKNWTPFFSGEATWLNGAKTSLVLSTDTPVQKGEFTATASVPIHDWNMAVIGNIVFQRSSNLMALYRRTSTFLMLTILISFIIIWLTINFTIRNWVTKPLQLVTNILETEESSKIIELQQFKSEFKQIGTLFNDFVAQKKELTKAKEKAEESELLKTAFLANMSHEIRTPMNGILGFVELLKETNLSGEEQQEYIGIIAESGKRMLNIINDIISISKVEAGHTELVISETNINDQLKYIYTFFKHEAESKGLKLSYRTGLSDLKANVMTDREKIYAILTNLVKNAVKFTIDGSIELGYQKKGAFLEFSVIDSGIGIRKDHLEIIFERFRQASESLSRHFEGAGLGLAISKAYVEILGGKMWVESEFGKGSAFYFTIPYIPLIEETNHPGNELSEKWEDLNNKGLKILIAEDDPISDLFLRKLILPFAKEVLKVKNGTDAVDICRKNPDIDLVLMDIQMPGIDGNEATRQIRLFNQEVIIVAQTALGINGERERSLASGCNDYIAKPISVGDFNNLISKYFDKRV